VTDPNSANNPAKSSHTSDTSLVTSTNCSTYQRCVRRVWRLAWVGGRVGGCFTWYCWDGWCWCWCCEGARASCGWRQ